MEYESLSTTVAASSYPEGVLVAIATKPVREWVWISGVYSAAVPSCTP